MTKKRTKIILKKRVLLLSPDTWVLGFELINLPYLFDYKPRLIKHFFIISCGLQSRAAYILDLFTLSKSIDDVQSFLGCIFSTKLSFRILSSSVSRAHRDAGTSVGQGGRKKDEGNANL